MANDEPSFGVDVDPIRPLMLEIRPRRWPHRLYNLGWFAAALSWASAIIIAMVSKRMPTTVKAGGIGLFLLGLILVAVLLVAGLDRRWPRRFYRSVLADEHGLTVTRRGRSGRTYTLDWANIESVDVERRPLVTELRVIGAGEHRSNSLRLSSLAWYDLDELLREILTRSPARLVEGRRGRLDDDYS
jgi:hypothetical protein